MTVTHKFVSAIPDGTDATLVKPSNWNDTHTVAIAIADLTATGTPSASTFLRGDNQWATPAGGGSVTTTGSPANGNLSAFSGATSITNTDLTGDVTTSGGVATTIASNAVTTGKINANAVTYAKIQSETASTLLGNPTGVGAAPSEITLGATLQFSGSALQTKAFTSDVTASANSHVTTVAAIQGTTVSGTTGSGNVVFSSSPTMTNPVVGTQSTADNSTKAASTAYVTTAVANAVAGVNPAVAVQWATTQASDTSSLTYANGVAGVGATLTGVNNATTTIDGHTFVVGDVGVTRILVKNDTQSPSGAFNGVYLFTALHTGITGDVFTRALDYDMPSDINNTGAIPVVNGSAANANTSWLLTSTVNTVGTDPLTYVQFSLAPSTLATLTGTQTLTNKKITKRVTTAADATSITPNTDSADITYQSNSQTAGTLTINADAGSNQTEGQAWLLKLKCTNVQTLSWNTIYTGGTVALPTATTGGSKTDFYSFYYDSVASKWRYTGTALGFT